MDEVRAEQAAAVPPGDGIAAADGGRATPARGAERASARPSWIEWLTTTDHKKIGTMYLVTAFVFFIVGGVMALLMRAELARPGLQLMSNEQFNQAFT
ncbi:cytochrome ubiquinol oxidase subunit I, partial [Streptomyces sp. SID89]|nr:cytochrome ubiquinol oxidase subunit I [Streptomyces sp. SID89]